MLKSFILSNLIMDNQVITSRKEIPYRNRESLHKIPFPGSIRNKQSEVKPLGIQFYQSSMMALFAGYLVWAIFAAFYLSPFSETPLFQLFYSQELLICLLVVYILSWVGCYIASVKGMNQVGVVIFFIGNMISGFFTGRILLLFEPNWGIDVLWRILTSLIVIHLLITGGATLFTILSPDLSSGKKIKFYLILFFIIEGILFIIADFNFILPLVSSVYVIMMIFLMEIGAQDVAMEIEEGYWLAGILSFYMYYFFYLFRFFGRFILILLSILIKAAE